MAELDLTGRESGLDYTPRHREMLIQTASVISQALALSERADEVRV